MLYSNLIVIALVASNNLAVARPLLKLNTEIDARELEDQYVEYEKRDPGLWDKVKSGWDSPAAKAT
jgi:hypothetical protein